MVEKRRNEGLVPLSLLPAVQHETGLDPLEHEIQQAIRSSRLRVQTRLGRKYIADADLDAFYAEHMAQVIDHAPNLVTLRVYSGRPDPMWALSAHQIEHLATLINTLTPLMPVPPMEEGGLGYQGFLVGRITTTNLSEPVIAAHGRVWQGQGRETRAYADPALRVERWLLDTGHAVLGTTLFLTIEAALIGKEE